MKRHSAPSAGELPSIALIVLYYGMLPANFPVWLRTCAENPTIDWLFFTDIDLANHSVPTNVHSIKMSFSAVKALFEERLAIGEICLPKPYKICDFRPAFGLIFEDWLKDYELWGHCDMDVVWGNLRKFFPTEMLRAHQKIQQSGHLTFYRNAQDVNEFFRQSHPTRDYRKVFTEPGVFAFDDCGGAHELAYLSGIDQVWMKQYVDADPLSYALRAKRHTNYRNQIFYWENGSVYREFVPLKSPDRADREYPATEREEFSHIHLQRRSMHIGDFDPVAARGFYITPDAYLNKVKAEHYLGDFRRLNPQLPFFRLKERLGSALKRRLQGN